MSIEQCEFGIGPIIVRKLHLVALYSASGSTIYDLVTIYNEKATSRILEGHGIAIHVKGLNLRPFCQVPVNDNIFLWTLSDPNRNSILVTATSNPLNIWLLFLLRYVETQFLQHSCLQIEGPNISEVPKKRIIGINWRPLHLTYFIILAIIVYEFLFFSLILFIRQKVEKTAI